MTRSVSTSRGALLVVGMRWTDRSIGLVSTLILARLLVPEDFGIIAMASIVIGLIDALLDVGVGVALIQNRDAVQEDYDAAWTLRMIQCALAASIVVAVAEPAATYFRDPRVASVVQVLALAVLISGLENIGTVNFQKNREFGVEFRYLFIRRVCAFVITMVAAWFLRSYWALVIGTLGARLTGVALSYAMHPMRPRIRFARMKALLSFSTWNLVRGLAGFVNDNLHRFFVGGREPASVMGAYSVASEISALPSTELLAPLSRVLFPTFVAMRNDRVKLLRAFLLALGVQALIGVPAGVGLAVVADDAVRALLGEKWLAAIPFVQIIGLVNVNIAIAVSGAYLLLALGHARVTALAAWTAAIVFAILVLFAFPQAGAVTIASLRLAVATSSLAMFYWLVKREFPPLKARDVLGAIWRPILAAGVMAAALLVLPGLQDLHVLARLATKVALGATIFGIVTLALWQIAGRPDGAERYLLEKSRLDRFMRGRDREPPR